MRNVVFKHTHFIVRTTSDQFYICEQNGTTQNTSKTLHSTATSILMVRSMNNGLTLGTVWKITRSVIHIYVFTKANRYTLLLCLRHCRQLVIHRHIHPSTDWGSIVLFQVMRSAHFLKLTLISMLVHGTSPSRILCNPRNQCLPFVFVG